MTPAELVQSLKTVPELRLRLVELAWECVGPDGRLDMEKAAQRVEEVENAAEEARALIHATERVRWALTRRHHTP